MPTIQIKVHKIIPGFPAKRPTAEDIAEWKSKWPNDSRPLKPDFLSGPRDKRSKTGIHTIEADENGVPMDWHWRRRLRAAVHDGCCEVVVEKPGPKRVKTVAPATEEVSNNG